MDRLGHDHAQPAQRFYADRHAKKRRSPAAAEALTRGQHRRHDDRAAVHRPALERIVEILAVRGGAVDHRRILRAEFSAMAQRAAGAAAVDAGDQSLDVPGISRGDAEARNVDQQLLGACAHRDRDLVGAKGRDTVCQPLADGGHTFLGSFHEFAADVEVTRFI